MAGENETMVEAPLTTTTTTTVEPIEEKKDLAEAGSKEEKKDEEKKAPTESPSKKDRKKKEGGGGAAASSPVLAVHKKDFEKDVVYLYQFGRCPQVPSVSPHCLKTETWIKICGIPYENVDHKSKLRSKRGLLPFVEFNGEEIADSDIIIKTLGAKYDKNIDEGLTREQCNVQRAMLSMVDNHLLWMSSQWQTRNVDNILKGYNLNLQKMTRSKVPNGLLAFAFKHTMVRKLVRQIKAVGFDGYSDEEIDKMGSDDLKVLSDLLGEKQFFFGDEPRSLDISAFTQLALILNVDKEVSCPLRDYLESECTNLIGLYNRIKDRAWGDHWDEAVGDKLEMNPHIPKPEPPTPAKEESQKQDEKETADEKQEKAPEKKEEAKETNENKVSENKASDSNEN